METLPILFHAVSPLHAGTGQSVDVVDLPIARTRSTGVPFLPGSSIKGVLRDAARLAGGDPERLLAVFGPETKEAADHAGALIVGDARLVAMPVRSFKGTFAWVTSPLLLELARRDLAYSGAAPAGQLPRPDSRRAFVLAGSEVLHNGMVYLEDLDLSATENESIRPWADLLARLACGDSPATLTKRFVVVDDDTLSFLAQTATQVDARIRLDPETRTVAKGALWYEESLPPETLMIGLLASEGSRRKNVTMSPAEVLKDALPSGQSLLQFGGKATVGRGLCRVVPVRA